MGSNLEDEVKYPREEIKKLIHDIYVLEENIENEQSNSYDGTANIKSLYEFWDLSNKVRRIAKISGDKELIKEYGKYKTPSEIKEGDSGSSCGCSIAIFGFIAFGLLKGCIEYYTQN